MLANNTSIPQIVFKEDFGTEGRGGYFDQYGYVGSNCILTRFMVVLCIRICSEQ
jgi:glucose-6-phosphate 1-dehydrogenase